ncbi:MAG: hypothetical protein SGI96_05695 [Bacteroidota bacterium]|nr:hypothetical protein [Bacteroidota bacterium]
MPNRDCRYSHAGLDPVSFPHYLHRMADVHIKKTRSYNMSRIRSANTKPGLPL